MAEGESATSQLPSPVPFRRKRRFEHWLLAICITMLLLATIPPLINLGRFQHRIAGAISHSLGRPVTMRGISLRLLPWPAFKIEDLTVAEDPKFGTEPALRAPEVVIEPRLSSLWRGRFELSRVELTDASVNLVRNSQGRWSIASVLLQASQIANSPTGQARPGTAPRFPYIDATGTRINFKQGLEKLPYSLLNADFSMWLDRPELWHMKLEGQPVRTDLDLSLSDTGLVHLEGDLHRASAFGTMPLVMDGEWSHAPLGQLSRLILGHDASWRGDIDLTAHFEGELDRLEVRSHLKIADLHRQEFTPAQSFVVDATCRGLYSRSVRALNLLHCRWPIGDGALVLEGETPDAPAQRSLTATVNNLPASFFASVLGLWRAGAPPPSQFSGVANGTVTLTAPSTLLTSAGSSQAARAGWSIAADLNLPALQIAGARSDDTALTITGVHVEGSPADAPNGRGQPTLVMTADPVPMGVPRLPLAVSAELSLHGYALHANGAATLPALQQAAGALHLPALRQMSPQADGIATAQIALTAAGAWLPGDPADSPGVTGTLQLNQVLWELPWLPRPVELREADAEFSPGSVRWNTSAAAYGDAPNRTAFSGSALVPLTCNAATTPRKPNGCAVQASISTQMLDTGALQASLRSDQNPLLAALLQRFDRHGVTLRHLPTIDATVRAATLQLARLPIHSASLVLHTGDGAVLIDSLDGQMLGGRLHLSGTIGVADGTPAYSVHALVNGAAAPQVAALWQQNWGPGTLGGSLDLQLSGLDAAALQSHAKGTFRASWLRGSLGTAIPHFSSWDGTGLIGPGGIQIEHSSLSGTPATLTGTIGWDRALKLEQVTAPGVAPEPIAGSLAHPETAVASPEAPSTPAATIQ